MTSTTQYKDLTVLDNPQGTAAVILNQNFKTIADDIDALQQGGVTLPQPLATTDSVQFATVTATGGFVGDGSFLTNLPIPPATVSSPLQDSLNNPSVDFENRKLVSNTHAQNAFPDSFTYDQQNPFGPNGYPNSFTADFSTPDTIVPYPHDFNDDTLNTGEYFTVASISDWKSGNYFGNQGSNVVWADVSSTAYNTNYPTYTENFTCDMATGACLGDQGHTGAWEDYSSIAYSVVYGITSESFTCDQSGNCSGNYGSSGQWSSYSSGAYSVNYSQSSSYVAPLDWSTGVLLDKDGNPLGTGGTVAGRIDTDGSGVVGFYDNNVLIAKLDANLNGNSRALVVTSDATQYRYASIGVNDANDSTKGCFLGIDYTNGNSSITTGYTAWPLLIGGSINCFMPRDGVNTFGTTVDDQSGAKVQVAGDVNITGTYRVNGDPFLPLPAPPDNTGNYVLQCLAGVFVWISL